MPELEIDWFTIEDEIASEKKDFSMLTAAKCSQCNNIYHVEGVYTDPYFGYPEGHQVSFYLVELRGTLKKIFYVDYDQIVDVMMTGPDGLVFDPMEATSINFTDELRASYCVDEEWHRKRYGAGSHRKWMDKGYKGYTETHAFSLRMKSSQRKMVRGMVICIENWAERDELFRSWTLKPSSAPIG